MNSPEPQPFRGVHDLLDQLERDSSITLAQVADVLHRRWPEGVVIAVYESAGPAMIPGLLSWRGDYRTALYLSHQLYKLVESLGQTTILPVSGGPHA